MTHPILIAGPTASGKSALALGLAERLGGVVINADSQQVFRDWRMLTARPGVAEEARAPHRLFGHVALTCDYSVGTWLREVAPVLGEARETGRAAILVGGTGLYFKALTEGLAPIPDCPPKLRAEGAAELARTGLPAFAERLARADPETAAGLDLANPRRVLRAWEVLTATGQGLAAWQAETGPPVLPLAVALPVVLTPPRDWLYARCETRFDAMLEGGALDEARAVLAQGLPPAAPGMKALGAAELIAHLRGEIDIDAAARSAKTATRRYAKRQLTWGRNQMADWHRCEETRPAELLEHVHGLYLARGADAGRS